VALFGEETAMTRFPLVPGAQMTLQRCDGCYDDFYNDKNPYGVKRCWSFTSAQIVLKKEVHIDQRPPWRQKAQPFPDCYRKQRYVYVAPDQEN